MTQAKERPILFSAPMVRAILEGRKTVTRREVKVQPRSSADIGSFGRGQPFIRHPDVTKANPECPYGRPGDRLWVREAWQADAQVNEVAPRELSHGEPIRYPADGASRQTGCSMITLGKTRPSIHMPRWVSRILLEITDVRVERLQAITYEEAAAEGVHRDSACRMWTATDEGGTCHKYPVPAFRDLWSGINGAENWNANPWVWVVEFKRVTP
ncbi:MULTISPECIES: hypothetical protein [Pseudomonas syringae group]|uniref:Phage-related protein n=2 Tax=Pseudomonas syringae group TaxID=136849 RepID=A0AAW4DWI1_PSESX|nr:MULTISPECIES: hypothetical protein [Pseudomonas syringae group]EEB60594.1 hypothetical protein PSPTOT1_4950 [Pseudomonas syringae pv. tomato T1]KGK95565.1 hypothetical protein NB04_09950 [Pseudomonas syringae pv. tomato]KUR43653.1 hypothetical protein PSTA9_02844 [Pseudomonas syringae pv. tomato]KUR50564.1 hypothetical protein PST407_01333 [Pseudomonas syringae pv. tomato]MBI6697664.1 hypothetical protein [Pseudomonas syringae]